MAYCQRGQAVHGDCLSWRRRCDDFLPVPQRRERAARPETGVSVACRARCRGVADAAGGKTARHAARGPRFRDRGGLSVTMTALESHRDHERRLGDRRHGPSANESDMPTGSGVLPHRAPRRRPGARRAGRLTPCPNPLLLDPLVRFSHCRPKRGDTSVTHVRFRHVGASQKRRCCFSVVSVRSQCGSRPLQPVALLALTCSIFVS